MSYTRRACDTCGIEYKADNRNLKRGWGLCCSKSCAAKKRERSKPDYDPKRVARNNIRRKHWVPDHIYEQIKQQTFRELYWGRPETNYYGTYYGHRTSEDYRMFLDGHGGYTAVDEFDQPVYSGTIGIDDSGDSEYWETKNYN